MTAISRHSVRFSRRFCLAIVVTLACVAVRSLIPVGYMPGNLLRGELIEMCPVAADGALGLIAGLQPLADPHENHRQHDDRDRSVDETCPLGQAIFASGLPTLPPAEIDIPAASFLPGLASNTACLPRTVRPYRTRAPPRA